MQRRGTSFLFKEPIFQKENTQPQLIVVYYTYNYFKEGASFKGLYLYIELGEL